MLQELRSGIHVLESQNNQIVSEATELFSGMRQELEAISKRISDNTLQLLAAKSSTQAVQKGVSVLSKRVDEVNQAMTAITTSLKQIPSKRELQLHATAMEEHKQQMMEMNTGLTTAMEEYKISQSSPYDFRRSSAVAGPSGMHAVHLQRQAAFDKSPSVSSLIDTGSEYSWHAQLRGGAGSNARGADGGAAGRADTGGADGDVGGAGGGGAAGDPPPPPDPPPSDHGRTGGRCMSRRQRRIKELEFAKPIQIKEPKIFYGKVGEDFDTWWVLVQVYIEDQPEKFPKDERTIDWIGSLMDSYVASCHI